jgi:N-acetylmuramoyl-L-alanine amidase
MNFKVDTNFFKQGDLDKSMNDKIFFIKFPEKQIKSSIRLNQYLIKKHGIKPCNVLYHSDIAVPYLRKQDPGPLFPSKIFASMGIGLWPSENDLIFAKKILCEKKILDLPYKKKKDFFIKQLMKFGFHDPIYSEFDLEKKIYKKFNLKKPSEKEKYLNEINKMIIIYKMHYKPEEEISEKLHDKDLLIVESLNYLKKKMT